MILYHFFFLLVRIYIIQNNTIIDYLRENNKKGLVSPFLYFIQGQLCLFFLEIKLIIWYNKSTKGKLVLSYRNLQTYYQKWQGISKKNRDPYCKWETSQTILDCGS